MEKGVGGGRGTVRGFTFALKNSVGLGGGGGGGGAGVRFCSLPCKCKCFARLCCC